MCYVFFLAHELLFCALLCFQIILPMTRSLSAMVSMVFSCHYVDVSNLTRYFTSLFFSLSLSLSSPWLSHLISLFYVFQSFVLKASLLFTLVLSCLLFRRALPLFHLIHSAAIHWSLCPFSSLLFSSGGVSWEGQLIYPPKKGTNTSCTGVCRDGQTFVQRLLSAFQKSVN